MWWLETEWYEDQMQQAGESVWIQVGVHAPRAEEPSMQNEERHK